MFVKLADGTPKVARAEAGLLVPGRNGKNPKEWQVKGIKQILRDAGLEISDEKLAEIDKAVAENYATRAELGEKREKIQTLQKQVDELGEQITSAAGDAEKIEALQKQVEEFKAAEGERQAKAQEKSAREEFEKNLAAAVGEKKFANELTKRAIFDEAFETHKANPDMSAADILKAATENQANVWENPQTSAAKMPTPGTDENTKNVDRIGFANALFGGRK